MGLYWEFTAVLGRHITRRFSAMKIEDFITFLRMTLTIKEIDDLSAQIEKVEREWTKEKNANGFLQT
jgi:hypothetical protein